MVEQAVSWCVGIIMMVDVSYIIYLNVVQISAKIKCRKKQYSKLLNACHESGCKWAEYCENYEHKPTEEEIASLEKLIEEMRRKQQCKDAKQ